METKTASNRIPSLLALYDMQTTFFTSSIDGISDKDALNRMDTKANHIAWLAGSIVQQRYELAQMLGMDMKQEADDLFKNNKGIQEGAAYPSLATYRKDWEKVSPAVREKLVTDADDTWLDKILDFPDMNMSFPQYEMLTFSLYREANCIGQIALWRRLLGYDAMKYM